MKINKAILLGGVFALLASGASFVRVQAMSPEALSASCDKSRGASTKVKAASKIQEVDNSGRKLALSIPGLGTAHISLTPAAPSAPVKGVAPATTFPYGITHKGNSITVKVPETVDEALDYGHVAVKQATKVGSAALMQMGSLAKWIGMYLKQLTHNATVTPASYPYIQQQCSPSAAQVAGAHKLYLTSEGRLKTVVSR